MKGILSSMCFCYLVLLSCDNGILWAASVDLPKTGQMTCYNVNGKEISCEGTGQDGDIRTGVKWPEPRFHDNGDGTITDNLTGLMWLKDGLCLTSKSGITWSEAFTAVADFNTNQANYRCVDYSAHYTDWVLPNVNELQSMLNSEVSSSDAWWEEQGFVNVNGYSDFWSSTASGWSVNGHNQVTPCHGTESFFYVLPVRSSTSGPAQIWQTGQAQSIFPGDDGDLQRGVSWPSPRFTDNNNGTVTDNLTGLAWIKDADCFGRKNWQEALDAVQDLNVNPQNYECNGYSANNNDWRLPNRTELRSLIDHSKYGPALPQGHPFVGVLNDLYWSSTTRTDHGGGEEQETDEAWGMSMVNGEIYLCYGDCDKSGRYMFVWPVRGGIIDPPGPSDPCDLNGDGKFTRMDVLFFHKGCKKGTADWECDLNDDGKYDKEDRSLFKEQCSQ